MAIPGRQVHSELACSVNEPHIISLDSVVAGFTNGDVVLNITIVPAVVQAGALSVSYAGSFEPALYAAVYDDFGEVLDVPFTSASTTIVVTDTDVCKLRFTNNGVAADQLYDVHVVSVGG